MQTNSADANLRWQTAAPARPSGIRRLDAYNKIPRRPRRPTRRSCRRPTATSRLIEVVTGLSRIHPRRIPAVVSLLIGAGLVLDASSPRAFGLLPAASARRGTATDFRVEFRTIMQALYAQKKSNHFNGVIGFLP
jgi:hypothetical protein